MYDRKTYLPERGVLVSTICRNVGAVGAFYNLLLAPDGVVREGDWAIETEIFAARGPTWDDVTMPFLYHENHDDAAEEALDAAHERIVAAVRDGTIVLRPLQGSLLFDREA